MADQWGDALRETLTETALTAAASPPAGQPLGGVDHERAATSARHRASARSTMAR